jgi:hypothetical protein
MWRRRCCRAGARRCGGCRALGGWGAQPGAVCRTRIHRAVGQTSVDLRSVSMALQAKIAPLFALRINSEVFVHNCPACLLLTGHSRSNAFCPTTPRARHRRRNRPHSTTLTCPGACATASQIDCDHLDHSSIANPHQPDQPGDRCGCRHRTCRHHLPTVRPRGAADLRHQRRLRATPR